MNKQNSGCSRSTIQLADNAVILSMYSAAQTTSFYWILRSSGSTTSDGTTNLSQKEAIANFFLSEWGSSQSICTFWNYYRKRHFLCEIVYCCIIPVLHTAAISRLLSRFYQHVWSSFLRPATYLTYQVSTVSSRIRQQKRVFYLPESAVWPRRVLLRLITVCFYLHIRKRSQCHFSSKIFEILCNSLKSRKWANNIPDSRKWANNGLTYWEKGQISTNRITSAGKFLPCFLMSPFICLPSPLIHVSAFHLLLRRFLDSNGARSLAQEEYK